MEMFIKPFSRLKWSLVFVLFCLLSVELKAQVVDSTECYTIIFKTGRETSVTVDFIISDSIVYRLCPDDYDRTYKVPLAFVKEIKSPEGKEALSLENNGAAEGNQLLADKEKQKEWIFSHKTNKMIKRVNSRQKIKVTYWGANNKLKKVKGKLSEINETSLLVSKRSGETVEINKNSVTRISIPGILGPFGMALFGIAAFLTLGLMAGFLLFSVGDGLGLLLSGGQSDPDLRSNIGCLPVILSLAATVVLFLLSHYKPINEPFSGEWEINLMADNSSLYEKLYSDFKWNDKNQLKQI